MTKCKIINITGSPQAGKHVLFHQHIDKGDICLDYAHLKYLPTDYVIGLLKEEVGLKNTNKIMNDITNFDLFYNIISKMDREQIIIKTSFEKFEEVNKYDLLSKIVIRDLRMMWMILSCEETWTEPVDVFIDLIKRHVETIQNCKSKYELIEFNDFYKCTFTKYDNGLLLKLKPYDEIESDVRLIEKLLSEELLFFGYEPVIDLKEF